MAFKMKGHPFKQKDNKVETEKQSLILQIRQIETKYKWNPNDMPNEVKTQLQQLKQRLKQLNK